ncbi:MAG: hypothetical protein ABIS67_09965, partial [Candidatus Eisenbacteria bacterium]
MSDPNTISLPALPDRARPVRWRYFSARLGMVLALLLAAAFLPQARGMAEKFRYREGDIARERVVAPHDFRVEKDEAQLRREQEIAVSAVPPVFTVDPRVSGETLNRFALFQEKVMAAVSDAGLPPADRVGRLRSLGVPLAEE